MLKENRLSPLSFERNYDEDGRGRYLSRCGMQPKHAKLLAYRILAIAAEIEADNA
jgi:hypothetical protein